jgi:hypothetical protein
LQLNAANSIASQTQHRHFEVTKLAEWMDLVNRSSNREMHDKLKVFYYGVKVIVSYAWKGSCGKEYSFPPGRVAAKSHDDTAFTFCLCIRSGALKKTFSIGKNGLLDGELI